VSDFEGAAQGASERMSDFEGAAQGASEQLSDVKGIAREKERTSE
jgi:hypothetical protein